MQQGRPGARRRDRHRAAGVGGRRDGRRSSTSRRRGATTAHYRRGIYLLPSIFTVGNMFCGYACIVFSMRGELVDRGAVHRLRVRARHARRPHRAPDEHDERVRRRARFARRRHLVRHRARRAGVRVGTVGARARRLGGGLHLSHRGGDAARAVQHPDRPRSSTSGTSSACRRPPAAGVVAATVFAWPYPLGRAIRRRSPRSRSCSCRRR